MKVRMSSRVTNNGSPWGQLSQDTHNPEVHTGV